MSVLKVNEVSKAFENEKIIENISLELHEGELVSLLGVSGGGKTTLFNIGLFEKRLKLRVGISFDMTFIYLDRLHPKVRKPTLIHEEMEGGYQVS